MTKKKTNPPQKIDLPREIDNISANIFAIQKQMNETGRITIRSDQLVALCEAVAPIKCMSPECLYSKDGTSCFINPVCMNKGICPYYNPDQTSINRTDMPERVPVNRKTSPPRDQEGG
jgi:hypothetical protein